MIGVSRGRLHRMREEGQRNEAMLMAYEIEMEQENKCRPENAVGKNTENNVPESGFCIEH